MQLTKERVEENLQKIEKIGINWVKRLKPGAPVYFESNDQVFAYVFIGHIPSMLTIRKQVLAYDPVTDEIERFNMDELFGNIETLKLYTAERFK